MEVILLEKIGKLGGIGDKANVKAGFGRNYLIPQGKAVFATESNIAEFELRRADLEANAAAKLAEAEARAAALVAIGTLTISANPASSGTTAFLDFADLTFSTATITARGALIYLANGGTNPAVAVLDFGSDKTSTAGDFTIVFPAADASNAIIRIA